MKKIVLLVLIAAPVWADVPVPPPATQAQVNAGTATFPYVSPATLAGYSGNGTNVSLTTVTNVALQQAQLVAATNLPAGVVTNGIQITSYVHYPLLSDLTSTGLPEPITFTIASAPASAFNGVYVFSNFNNAVNRNVWTNTNGKVWADDTLNGTSFGVGALELNTNNTLQVFDSYANYIGFTYSAGNWESNGVACPLINLTTNNPSTTFLTNPVVGNIFGVVTNTLTYVTNAVFATTNGAPFVITLGNTPDPWTAGTYVFKGFLDGKGSILWTNTANSIAKLYFTNDLPNNNRYYRLDTNGVFDVYDTSNFGPAGQETIGLGTWADGYINSDQGYPNMYGFTNGTPAFVPSLGNVYFPSTLPLTNNIVAYVSSAGIANGLATIPNNGYPYGPDTLGTLTCGIQEACNAAQIVYLGPGLFTLYGGLSVGRDIIVGSGQWLLSSQNQVGTVIYCHNGYVIGRSPHISHCLFAGDNNGMVYLYIGELGRSSFSEAIVEDCYFTPYTNMLNQITNGIYNGVLSGLYDTGIYDIADGYGSDIIRGNNFEQLACALNLSADHICVENNQFQGTATSTNNYSTNDFRSVLPSIAINIAPGTRTDDSFIHNVFVNTKVGYLIADNNFNQNQVWQWSSYNDNFEGGGIPMICTNSRARWTFIAPSRMYSPYEGIRTNGMYCQPGSWANGVYTNNISLINDSDFPTPTVINGWKVMGTNSADYFVGDGSGLTNFYGLATNTLAPISAHVTNHIVTWTSP